MTQALQSIILMWAILFNVVAALGLWGALKARRWLVHPGVVLFVLFFMGFGLPALLLGLGEPLLGQPFKFPDLPGALAFASLFLFLLWGGFYLGLPLLRSLGLKGGASQKNRTEWNLPPNWAPIIMSVTAFLIYYAVISYTGGAFFQRNSIFVKGAFDAQAEFNTTYSIISLTILFSASTYLAGVIWGRQRNIILFLSPLLYIVYLTSKTSRGAFLPLLYFFLGAYLASHKPRRVAYYLIIAGVSAAVGLVLITYIRGGVGWKSILYPLDHWDTFRNTFLDRTGVDSLYSMNYAYYIGEGGFKGLGFFPWLFSLVPIPSFFGIGWTHEYYVTVAFPEIIGRELGGGWPVPVLGELYLQMGWAGALIGLPIGLAIAKTWDLAKGEDLNNFNLLGALLYIAIIDGVLMSFHSGSRNSTRMVIYLYLLWWILKLFKIVNPMTTKQPTISMDTRSILRNKLSNVKNRKTTRTKAIFK